MKILAIQNSAGDSPAAAGEMVERMGHALQVVRIDRNEPVPTSVDADALMLFGGAASLTSRDLPAWIQPELELIRKFVHEGRRVLGICLGSQMVASALGAPVRRNTNPEVGWHLVDRVETISEAADVFPEQFTTFHWHQDTFGIPTGAQHLLRSDGCSHQGFVMDDRVFALQFHLEANRRTVEIFLMVSKMHKQPGRFVQTETQILEGVELYLAKQTEILSNFLQNWLA